MKSPPFLVELVKAKIAAPVLAEFESPLDAIGVAADALVVSRVGEMLKDTLGEWRNVRAESVVNPFAFLAGLDKTSVAQKRQVSGKGGLRRLKRVAQLANAKLVVAQRSNHPQASRVCQSLGKCDGGFHISAYTDMFCRCQRLHCPRRRS